LGVPNVGLEPFELFHSDELAERLCDLVRGNASRLRQDFPRVVTRYGTYVPAQRSVINTRSKVAASEGAYKAFAITANNVVCGVATYLQAALYPRRGVWGIGQGQVLIHGPQIAVWLGSTQIRSRGLLPHILRAGAAMLARNERLYGLPWTLVRPTHLTVRDALKDAFNGFEGFRLDCEARRYRHVDGVRSPRLLYVSNADMQRLRTLHGTA